MHALKALCMPVLFLMSCAPTYAQVSADGRTLINGNWHLSGSWGLPEPTPHLILSLGVSGDEVFGEGSLQVYCPKTGGSGTGFRLKGRIASDGTFILRSWGNDPSGDDPNLIQISGKVPEPSEAQWSGRFEFNAVPLRSPCNPSGVKGDFVATRLPALNGEYSGTIHMGHASEGKVSLQIAQGGLALLETKSGRIGQITLKATMTVTTVSTSLLDPTIPSEKLMADVSGPNTSQLRGDEFILEFPTNDGYGLELYGRYLDASQQTLQVFFSRMHYSAGAGTLTKQ